MVQEEPWNTRPVLGQMLACTRLRWTREFDRVPPKDTFYKDHEAASCGRAHACFCLVKFAQLLSI